MYCYDSSPRMIDCAFIGNEARFGAGIECVGGSIILEGCSLTENDAPLDGGAVRIIECSAMLDHCWFEENEANGGSALAIYFGSFAVVEHCTFVSNVASYGGTVDCWGDSSPILRSCTFYGNYGPDRGTAIRCEESSFPEVERCIISFGDEGEPVWCDGTSGAYLTCCDIYGNEGGDWVGCIADQLGQDGNISEHPLFCGPEIEDFTIADNSPCAPFTPPNPECDLIGAWPVGCGPASVPENPEMPGMDALHVTWGRLKSVFGR